MSESSSICWTITRIRGRRAARSCSGQLLWPQSITLSDMPPDLAIVIVTYNSAHVVGDLLDSLPAALDGLQADIVVVDNGSSDGTAGFVTERGGCRVVLAETLVMLRVSIAVCAKRCRRRQFSS